MERQRPTAQHYAHYTKEDFEVWKLLFERQTQLLRHYASTEYLSALQRIGFTAHEIPRFADVSAKLKHLTGWELAVVPGHVPPRDFFTALANKVFPATCWLRTMAEVDYIEEPDMFHDVFGHVPLLVNSEYAAFMQAFGALALQWGHDEQLMEWLSRIYWFTIEFGLIRENEEDKIYGAGILSSPGETKHSMSDAVIREQFDAHRVLNTAFRTDVLQDRYFVIEGFAQLPTILPQINRIFTMANKHIPSLQ